MGTSRGELDQQPNRFKFEQQQLQEEEGSLLPRKPQGGGAPTSCLDLFYSSSPPTPPPFWHFSYPCVKLNAHYSPSLSSVFLLKKLVSGKILFRKESVLVELASFCLGP
jgi:hypothetical protein